MGRNRGRELEFILIPASPALVYPGVFVPAHTYRYSLKNLLPGKYAIFMQISTEAGAGAAGPTRTVMISEGGRQMHHTVQVI